MPTFGELLKQHRIRLELSLREFCNLCGFDHGNYSKLERGHFSPPQSSEKLESYAKALKLKRGSEEWLEFFDVAAMEQGRIPIDLLDDINVVEKLPVLFRTIRSKKITSEQLEMLIDQIKES